MPGGKCSFSNLWLENKDYKEWLEADTDKRKAYCKACKKAIDISSMGEYALKSHATGQKHKRAVKKERPAVPISGFLAKHLTESDETQVSALNEKSYYFFVFIIQRIRMSMQPSWLPVPS